MINKFPMKITLSAMLAALALTACGGGSDDSADDEAPPAAAEAADKYAGTWASACESTGATTSRNYVWTLSKAGAAAVTGNHAVNNWTNTTCTGTPNTVSNLGIAFTIDATGTANGKIVDKTTASVSVGGQGKLLFTVEGNTMYSSAYKSSTLDADGYPTQLKLDRPYMK